MTPMSVQNSENLLMKSINSANGGDRGERDEDLLNDNALEVSAHSNVDMDDVKDEKGGDNIGAVDLDDFNPETLVSPCSPDDNEISEAAA